MVKVLNVYYIQYLTLKSRSLIVVLIGLFILFSTNSFCYEKRLADSLEIVLSKSKPDDEKVKTLRLLAEQYQDKNPPRSLSYSKMLLNLSEELKSKWGISYAYFYIGANYDNKSQYSDALKYYLKSLAIAEEIDKKFLLIRCYNSIGILFTKQKNYKTAISYYLKGLEIGKDLKDKKVLATFNNNLGVLYKNLSDFKRSTLYYRSALNVFVELKHPAGIISTYCNVGENYAQAGQLDSALFCYNKAFSIAKNVDHKESIILVYHNMAEIYRKLNNIPLSFTYYDLAMKSINDGGFKYFRPNAKEVYEGLAKLYEQLKDYKNSYKYQTLFIAMNDSLQNEDVISQINEMSEKFESIKKEKAISELQSRNEIVLLKMNKQTAQLKKNKAILFSTIAGVLLVLILLFVLYSRYQLRARANKQLEFQNREIADKNKEITDSINYAKNIQQAMLPSVSILGKYFPQGFGLFKPKDVVSGDFYWFAEYGEKVFIAVADCTGHGVPGGFMSMIGINKLNNIVLEKKITEPSLILQSLNISLKAALKQNDTGSTSRDGMDISLCACDFKTNVVHFAGANRPMWIVRKGNAELEINEFLPDKIAIGGLTEDFQVFKQHSVPFFKGDVIYLFSDGFPDQFGGTKGKKLMTKNFKEALLSIQHLHMADQEKELEKLFEDWKTGYEQVDDVLVLGVRV